MRALVFAAIKANTLGQKFGAPIEKFGSWFMQTLPIFNTPFGKTGIGAITGEAKNLIWDGNSPGLIMKRRMDRDNKVVQQIIDERFPEPGAENKLTTEKINAIVTSAPKNAETAKEQFAAQGVTDMSAAVTNYGAAIYEAITKVKEESKQKEIWEAIWTAAGLDYNNFVKAQVTAQFDDLFKDVSWDPADDKVVQDILDKADKTVLKKFFDAYENKSQDKKFDKKTFTISTKDDKYTATEKK